MTIFRASFGVAFAGALLASGAAAAQEGAGQAAAPQDSAAQAGENIIVTGERPSHSEVSRQARDVTDIGSDIRDRPLARVEDRLCPGVIGLKRAGAELMIDRIRWNAERLKMWMAHYNYCQTILNIAYH
jgi:hypothetical protein